eukprot:CAMPEP_0184680872 /NCGR_PEP_ID=MMETSP0312-20130426/3803_1 /TAXON_ID=31354 /ORGANISM="Compsopogon coeruleus, Strain SAG 36.94" /LENGTH=261 /DNA_ID=CAMNT_0027131301 /DNA_START=59 /DNA_END=844 /DNA_ORIENTATION=-
MSIIDVGPGQSNLCVLRDASNVVRLELSDLRTKPPSLATLRQTSIWMPLEADDLVCEDLLFPLEDPSPTVPEWMAKVLDSPGHSGLLSAWSPRTDPFSILEDPLPTFRDLTPKMSHLMATTVESMGLERCDDATSLSQGDESDSMGDLSSEGWNSWDDQGIVMSIKDSEAVIAGAIRKLEVGLRLSQLEKDILETREFSPAELQDLSGSTPSAVRSMSDRQKRLVQFKRKLRNRESARRSRIKRKIQKSQALWGSPVEIHA